MFMHLQQGGCPSTPGASNTASRLRRKGELLGAWDGHEYQHPVFQFDQRTSRYAGDEGIARNLAEGSERVASSLLAVSTSCASRCERPAGVFQDRPQSVIGAARSTFAPVNTNW